MNKTIISITGAFAVSMGLSGCMATGQSGMQQWAQLQADTISDAERTSTPQFPEEQLASRYETLLERYREFREVPSEYLTADESSVCDLSEAGQWLVTHGKPESDAKAVQTQTNRPFKLSTAITIESVSLIEGECHNGFPEGPFIGIGKYRQVVTPENGDPNSNNLHVRMEGTAADGKMDGEFTFFAKSVSTSVVNGQTYHTTTLTASSGQADNGQDVGSHLIIAGQPQAAGFATLVRRNRQTAMGLQTEVKTYTGSRLTTTMNMLNHVSHGWMTNHLLPASQQRSCMIQGKVSDNQACNNMAVASVTITPVDEAELEQLVRKDNLGEYMSPYTSDGVLAEWVNMGASADIGGTAGSGAGAVAGSMIADKALESVPFGSLIGGVIGSKVGEEMGREAGISAAGGWETIKATSDRSFDSLTNMARYLAQKYGSEPTYSDALKVTMQVYPEFQKALASAY